MENLEKDSPTAQLSLGRSWKFQKIVGFCIQKGKRKYREKWVNLEEDRSMFVWKGIDELKSHWSSLLSFQKQNQQLIASHEQSWLEQTKVQMANEMLDRHYIELYLRNQSQSFSFAEDSEYEIPSKKKNRLQKQKRLKIISKKNKKKKRKGANKKATKGKGKGKLRQLEKNISYKSKIAKEEINQPFNSESCSIDMSNTFQLKDLLNRKLIQQNQNDNKHQEQKSNDINGKKPLISSALNRQSCQIEQIILENQGSTDLQRNKNMPKDVIQVSDSALQSQNICMNFGHKRGRIQLSDSSLMEANDSQQISYACEDKQLSVQNFSELKQIIKKRFLFNWDSSKDQVKIQHQNDFELVKREQVSSILNRLDQEVNESRDSNFSLSLQKDTIFSILQGEGLPQTFQQYFADHLILSLVGVPQISKISSSYRFKSITFYEIDIGNKYYEDKRFIPSYCLSPSQRVKIQQMRASINDQLR